jgi:lambda family phage tail tape measure protein
LRAHDLVGVKEYYDQAQKQLAIEVRRSLTIAKLRGGGRDSRRNNARQGGRCEREDRRGAGELSKLARKRARSRKSASVNRLKTATGESDPLAQQAERMELAAAKAQDVERKINAIYAELETQTQRIAYLVSTHQLSELEGEQELNKLRAQARDQVGGLADDYARLAEESGNPEIVANAKRIALSQEELGHAASMVRDSVIESTQQGFESLFQSILTGSQSAAAAFKGFASSIISSIAGIIAKMLAMWIIQKAIGFFPGGGGGIASSLGAGNAGGMGGIGMGGGIGSVGMHALGGGVDAGVPTIVGERGPELFIPGQSGAVFANDQVRGMGRKGATIYIDARGAESGVEEKIVAGMRQAAMIGGVMGYSATRDEARRGR